MAANLVTTKRHRPQWHGHVEDLRLAWTGSADGPFLLNFMQRFGVHVYSKFQTNVDDIVYSKFMPVCSR